MSTYVLKKHDYENWLLLLLKISNNQFFLNKFWSAKSLKI